MNELDRREFITFVGKACAGVAAAKNVVGEATEARGDVARQNGSGRAVYRGRNLLQIAMPMGGLGAGNIALGGRGNLRNWQIFNYCDPNTQMPASFFAIRTQTAGGKTVAKLLQLEPVGKLPLIDDVEFVGEYPFAWIDYKDAALPVTVRLESYSPYIPLNAQDSGIPGIVFRFTVKNPGAEPVSVSLAQTCRNAVGYDGNGSYEEIIANYNQYERRGDLHTLHLTTKTSEKGAGFSQPVVLLTESALIARMSRYFYNAETRYFSPLSTAQKELAPTATARIAATRGGMENQPPLARSATFDAPDTPVVTIVEDVSPTTSFVALEKFVAEGGRLLVFGGHALLEAARPLPANTDKPDIIYDDFEGTTYDLTKWTVEGKAFGDGPAHGALPNQQPVPGFQGGGFVNSYHDGDATTGRMTSRPFRIERAYIHFLIGGGAHPNETCINLKVDGAVVRTATGHTDERLLPEHWDVRPFEGKEGVIEIVDANTGGWGHINIDDIVFSDYEVTSLSPATREAIHSFLPFTFTSIEQDRVTNHFHSQDARLFKDIPAEKGYGIRTRTRLAGFQPGPGAAPLLDSDGQPFGVEWTHGKGAVSLFFDSLYSWFLDSPTQSNDRRTLLGSLIASLANDNARPCQFFPAQGMPTTHPCFGSMTVATSARDATHQAQWNNLDGFWRDFSADGRLKPTDSNPAPPGESVNGALAAHIALKPGETQEIVFTLGWHFPNRFRDRSYDVGFGSLVTPFEVKYRLGNKYDNWFKSSGEVADYLHLHDARLHRETKLFHDAFYDSALPYVLRDALSSQLCIPRSQTSMWLEDGHWMAYEGLGCCPMNCTHVYNYAQSLAKLFPELERNVRNVDLTVQLKENGGVRHRVQLPLDGPRVTEPFADGHFSTISKAYREHRQSADMAFLREHWPALQKAIDFGIRTYDPKGVGMAERPQPNTYDCSVMGYNSFISTQYLAALRAGEEMAKEMGDANFAQRCHDLFEKGFHNLDQTCWNGEYYQQVFDAYLTTPTQYGPGCLADQVLGQWWAHINGLGYVLPKERVRAALSALMKHNFITDFTHWDYHRQRVFASGKDQGLVCCAWPRGGRPEKTTPILYSDEVWTGVEYQVAAHLLFEGMTDDAIKIVTAIRARYDGANRNPWNEIECSDHYGRAMASWSVLLAASGYQYHGPKGLLRFAPAIRPENFRAFFTVAEGWGSFSQQRKADTQQNALHLAYGKAMLKELHFALPESAHGKALQAVVTVGDERIAATGKPAQGEIQIAFARPLHLTAGQTLQSVVSWR